MRTDGRTDRHDEANIRFAKFFANSPYEIKKNLFSPTLNDLHNALTLI